MRRRLLSSDAAAANPVGPASDGEVEDYRVTITKPSNGTVDGPKTIRIASGTNGGPTLAEGGFFGNSVAAIGDLDGDGVTDLAVGVERDDPAPGAAVNHGAVHMLFMNANGTVRSSVKVASATGGGPSRRFARC